MEFLFKLITVVTLATVAKSRTPISRAAPSALPYVQTPELLLPQAYYNVNPTPQDSYTLPLSLQLPKQEPVKIPFRPTQPIGGNIRVPQLYQNREPSEILIAPTSGPSLYNLQPNSAVQLPQLINNPEPRYQPNYNPQPREEINAPQIFQNTAAQYYDVPVPSQDLKAPVETAWNPDKDPKFYYEIPAILTKQQLPTNAYPKKYNKEIHNKNKPFSSRPKEEIAIVPIDEKKYLQKQKSISKVFQNLAKKENRKQIEADKIQVRKLAPKPKKQPLKASKTDLDVPLQPSASGFLEGLDKESATDSVGDYSQGLSSKLTAALGIPHSPEHGERVDFHMTGHDGPHSYKWGFDTGGKGHDRHFRYEERDKEGIVKGHFGFYDKHGKLKMVNYDSHPHEGFHAEEGNLDHY